MCSLINNPPDHRINVLPVFDVGSDRAFKNSFEVGYKIADRRRQTRVKDKSNRPAEPARVRCVECRLPSGARELCN
jgi:hypothetical protein